MTSDEEELLRSTALQNVRSILLARERADRARFEADEANRESATRLQLALDAGRLGDWSWDAASDVVLLSERASSIFGLPHGALITWTQMRELLHEDHRERARLAVEHALETKTDYDIEYPVARPSGGHCWIAARARGTYAADGAVAGMIGVVQDISARKTAEQELRSHEEQLRATFEQAAVGIAIADTTGKFIEANQKFADILGYGRDEILQRSFTDITYPDDRTETETQVRRLVAGEIGDYRIEKRYVRKDGSVIWGFATVTLTKNEAGAPVRFIGVIEDITPRRKTEEALRHSEQFNRTIIESSRDCIKTLSLEGEVLWISESGCRALQIDGPETVVGASWQAFWKAEDQSAARAAVQRAASGGTGTFVGSFSVGGRLRFWDVVLTPIRSVAGEPVMLLAVSRDVTERMEIERALREETRVLDILNKTGALLASQLDVEAVLQNVTDAATELSGAEIGAFFYNAKDENDDVFQLVVLSGAPREAFASFGHPRATSLFGPTFRGEGVIRSDDILNDERYGKWAPHYGMPAGHLAVRSYLAVPVVARSGEVLGGLFFGHPSPGMFTSRSERIISGIAAQAAIAIDNARLYEAAQNAAEERRKLLESERHARTQAERLSAIKDEFLAVLSHELRTPLSAILGWSHIMRHRVDQLGPRDGSVDKATEDMRKGLEVIERNARMQTQLIEDLLDMSRISSGKMRLEVHAVAPSSFIEAAIEMVRPAATAKDIRLELVLDREACLVAGDAGRLQQVVWNLLSNAIKFTPRGGRVQVRQERGPMHAEISVIDSGAGIRPDFLEHVFQRFRQADASTTRKHGGLGLGLAIVKQLVELHGGTVRADSEGEGHGATFTVALPLASESLGGEVVSARLPSTPPPSFKSYDLSGITVIVVDDEPDARTLVVRVLDECGAQVSVAAGAEEALALVERLQPHVIVSDISMPDVDGFELLRRLRGLGLPSEVPVIALTAFAREEDRVRTLEAGFARHLTKPIDLSGLVATVAELSGVADKHSAVV